MIHFDAYVNVGVEIMDFLVVAAATGAGYVAKFLQKSKESDDVVDSNTTISTSKPLFEHHGVNRLARVLEEGIEDEIFMHCGSNEDYNVLSLATLSPRFINEEDISARRSKRAVGIKNRRGYSVKPLTSLDSCVIAQLYNEHVEMEEHVFSAFPSPSASTARPLLVTDGTRIISRTSSDSYSAYNSLYKEDRLYSNIKETGVGVPPVPQLAPLQLQKKTKQKRGKTLPERSSSSITKVSSTRFDSQEPSDKWFLFCLGITFGVMSTVMANRREVDKLNQLLKQTENLVQDLHEELEMKDSLTVDVLAHENCDSQEDNNQHFANQEDLKLDMKSESMSKIEAELEAELERLEQNMNTSSLERRLSGLIELDPDSLADIVQGELRVDLVNGGWGDRTDSDRNTRGTSTNRTENVNYAVSPQELSLRLHEVLESRLEERIIELETALENSQKRLHSVESKQINSWRNYSNSEAGSSSRGSPTMRSESNNMMGQPLFLNLSDDALDAYNEAYEALAARTTGIDEDESSPPFMEYKTNQLKEELHSSDRSVLWSRNEGDENEYEVNEIVIQDESDDNDDDNEMARLLIKQLVQKARQGSPVVLNAQRMLFSMDEKSPLK